MSTRTVSSPDGTIIEVVPLDAGSISGPRILTKLEFTMLAAQAGGMPSVSAAKNDPALADFWVFFDLATQVERDHPFTLQGLAAMEAAGHLPTGAAAVIASWPNA